MTHDAAPRSAPAAQAGAADRTDPAVPPEAAARASAVATQPGPAAPSARRAELLELAYQYAVQHGRTDLSLRPMAAAIGSSPRVLLYLFGSKDGLVRALLGRARADELTMLAALRRARPRERAEAQGGAEAEAQAGAGAAAAANAEATQAAKPTGEGATSQNSKASDATKTTATTGPGDLADMGEWIWAWLSDPDRRPLLRLWLDGYARSLSHPSRPWAGFGLSTVDDWLALLGDAQPPARRGTADGLAERTLLLSVLRGALLDLLATDDGDRTTAAVQRYLAVLRAG
jgi:AcrR family transcriptional regulator